MVAPQQSDSNPPKSRKRIVAVPSQRPMGCETAEMLPVIEEILERIANGETLNAICIQMRKCRPDWPTESAFRKWVIYSPELGAKYARAREMQLEVWSDQIIAIAEDGSKDVTTRYTATGEPYDVENTEFTNRSKIRIDARKWLMSKLAPKKYGEKVVTPVDDNGEPTPVTLMFFGGRQLNGDPKLGDGAIDVEAERHGG